jgi:glycosyltransferase involved in cell wall biosynthesis
MSFALPPGVSTLHPELVNGGHIVETNMFHSMRPWFDVRSVGVASQDLKSLDTDPNSSFGIAHDLQLQDCAPEVLTRRASLQRLKEQYQDWITAGWKPDIVLVFNFSPIYSAFVRWLRRQPGRPALVLYLADAATLGERIPLFRRLRYRFKPMAWFEDEMLVQFDACVGVSVETEHYFKERNQPWYWYPGGVDPHRAIRAQSLAERDNVVFGYLGSLSEYAGLPDLIRIFESLNLPNHLHIAGGGKNRPLVEQLCKTNPRLHYGGNLTPDDALKFAQRCDVLINPRTTAYGNRNNFPSKVFDYALSGRSILSGRLSGVEQVLGSDAFYFDHADFDPSLGSALREVAKLPRKELFKRGTAIQSRMLSEFRWEDRAPGLANFLRQQMRTHR